MSRGSVGGREGEKQMKSKSKMKSKQMKSKMKKGGGAGYRRRGWLKFSRKGLVFMAVVM